MSQSFWVVFVSIPGFIFLCYFLVRFFRSFQLWKCCPLLILHACVVNTVIQFGYQFVDLAPEMSLSLNYSPDRELLCICVGKGTRHWTQGYFYHWAVSLSHFHVFSCDKQDLNWWWSSCLSFLQDNTVGVGHCTQLPQALLNLPWAVCLSPRCYRWYIKTITVFITDELFNIFGIYLHIFRRNFSKTYTNSEHTV